MNRVTYTGMFLSYNSGEYDEGQVKSKEKNGVMIPYENFEFVYGSESGGKVVKIKPSQDESKRNKLMPEFIKGLKFGTWIEVITNITSTTTQAKRFVSVRVMKAPVEYLDMLEEVTNLVDGGRLPSEHSVKVT